METLNVAMPLADSGDVLIKQARRVLTDEQIKALPSTPIDIVPSPGANRILVPVTVLVVVSKVAIYTNVDAGASLYMGYESSGAATTGPGNTDGHFVFDTDTIPLLVPQPIDFGVTSDALSNYTDLALTLIGFNTGAGDFTGGDAANTLTVTVLYMVVDV